MISRGELGAGPSRVGTQLMRYIERASRNPGIMLGSVVVLVVGIALALAVFGSFFLILLAGAIVAALTFLRPQFGLFAFVFLLYSRASVIIDEQMGLPPALPGVAILMGGLLLTALVNRDGLNVLDRFRLREWYFVALYVLVILATALVAVSPQLTVSYVSSLVRDVMLIAIIVLCVRNLGDIRLIVWSLILAGVVPATLTLIQSFTGTMNQFYGFALMIQGFIPDDPLVTEGVLRPSGPLGDPNYYALMLAPVIPLAVFCYWYEISRTLRAMALASTLIVSIAIFLTYSRGGVVTLLAVVGLLLIVRLIPMKLALIGLVALVLIVGSLPETYTNRFVSMFDTISSSVVSEPATDAEPDGAVSGRFDSIRTGVHMFIDHPVLGVGAKNYNVHYQDYARPYGARTRNQRSPHSLYVEQAAETGIVGLAALLVMVGSILATLTRISRLPQLDDATRSLASTIAAVLLTFLIGSAFLHMAYPRFLFVLIALAIGFQAAVRLQFPSLASDALNSSLLVDLRDAFWRWTRPTRAFVGGAVVLLAILAVLGLTAVISGFGKPDHAEFNYVSTGRAESVANIDMLETSGADQYSESGTHE